MTLNTCAPGLKTRKNLRRQAMVEFASTGPERPDWAVELEDLAGKKGVLNGDP